MNRRAENITSKQDKSWVGDKQMDQQQFDKTEYDKHEGKDKHEGNKNCCK